jgi:hypothetical protein
MEKARFRIYNKSKLFGSIATICVAFFIFGCGPAKIIKGQKAPQGTYECNRGYEKITCPECKGRGTLEISPWEQRSQKKASGTKSPLLGALSFFSKDKSPSSGYRTCWQCGGRKIVCKRDESVEPPSSSSRVSWEEGAVRGNVYMAASNGNFVLIDKLDRLDGDVFYVGAFPRPGESGPAKIPADAIEYALIKFVGLKKEYIFFDRFTSAIKEGMALKGHCLVECIYEGTPLKMRFIYRPGHKHLEILARGKSNAIDLSKVDVSIEK